MSLRPEPQSEIRSTNSVSNGAVLISYYRLIDPKAPDSESNRVPVSDEEVRALNADRRAKVTSICRTKSKASWEIPACQIGG